MCEGEVGGGVELSVVLKRHVKRAELVEVYTCELL